MTRILSTTIFLLLAGALAPLMLGGSATVPEPAALTAGAVTADTVRVAPPTGETDSDRANVQAAFDAVQSGGTVLFAPGTYLLGAGARLTVPDVTVLGHPEGTVLRGCDPEAFEVEYSEVSSVVFGCTGLYVEAERQTIRGLTFEYTWHGIVVGPFPASAEEVAALEEGGEPPPAYPAGGQRIEGNTFRNTPNGLRVRGIGNERSVVRDNEFIDVFHAIGIYGAPLHFLDNRVTVEEPKRVPFSGHPGSAIIVSPGHTDCAGHVVAGNRIEGYPDPIYVLVRRGESCHGVEIRDNTIHAARVKVPEAWGGYSPTHGDSTMVGAPITLMNRTEPTPGPHEAEREGVLEDILVRGNQIVGAEGLGIQIQGVSRSRIAGNTIIGIERRDPFPGITWDGFEQRWEAANGSGIWVSPGSEDNEIVGNTFEDIAAHAVFLEGDDNRVELRSASNSVRDLGRGNRVIVAEAPPDTIRYTVIIDGHAKGERRVWREGVATWRYEFHGDPYDSYQFPRSELLVLDADGLPIRAEVDGESGRAIWEERFEREEGRARWSTRARWKRFHFDPPDLLGAEHLDELVNRSGDTLVVGPAYYRPIYPAHDVGVVARALLQRDRGSLPLLPAGEARLETLGERVVEVEGRSRRLRHYAVHGLDLKPQYVWLDETGATFADEWSVRRGWDAAFPELRAATERSLADHHAGLTAQLLPPARERPLVIRGARLFDPQAKMTRSDVTIVVEGRRVTAVGRAGEVDVPEGAEVIDATGRTAVPGLWDLHAHHGIPSPYLEIDAPLHLAGGVTTARDLGSHTRPILSLQSRIEAGEAVGPRLLLAGFIDGPDGRPSGVLVGSPTEARAAVDRFAGLGYMQIKIYGGVPPDLVPVIIERADQHGLRVSGHVPAGMTVREAIEAGFDEIQHIDQIFANVESIPEPFDDLGAFYEAIAAWTADSVGVAEFIELLVREEVAVDPSLAILDSWSFTPHPWFTDMLDRLPNQARRRVAAEQAFKLYPVHPLWDDIYQNVLRMVHRMHEAGVPVLPGSDMMPGIAVHRELELYVQAGIPPADALALATLDAARVMGMDDELGSIEPGKLADLILVDGDPTTDISDIQRVVTVIKDGRVYDPAAIYRALGIRPCCED